MSRSAVEPPTFSVEASLWAEGYRAVAGVDEAGRGALAGPVVAAAVIVPAGTLCSGVWAEVRDSKQLRPADRERLVPAICTEALAWGVGSAQAAQIDAEGIAAATRSAMARAIDSLSIAADALVIDWVRLPMLNLRQLSFSRADARVASVAAASILAKVHRDGLLRALDGAFPAYGFAAHKGYGTRAHLEALARCGPCSEHRLTFAPLARDLRLLDDGSDSAG
jgi:ribonuclease HII